MATKNPRVAAYFPPELYKAFLAFKIQRGLATDENPKQNDSQALIQLVSEFLGVSYLVSQEVTHSNNFVPLERFEDLVSQVSVLFQRVEELSQKPNHSTGGSQQELLSKELENVDSSKENENRTDSLQEDFAAPRLTPHNSHKTVLLSAADLCRRLNVISSTMSRKKQSQEFVNWSREKDPDGIAWAFVPDSNLFQPIGDVPEKVFSELFSEPLEGITGAQLAQRLKVGASTLSQRKKEDTPQQFADWTRKADPDEIGWIHISDTNRYKPEKPLPGESPVVQGELLNATPSDQVNPLPEGSEQSGEG